MANHMAAHAGASERVVVSPADTGAALVDPGTGWVSHYYDNSLDNYGSHLEPSGTLDDFPGLNVIYFRLPWSFLEPEEGEFDWSLVDAPALRWTLLGKQIALRFTCSETSFNGTPDWVREAGAKGHDFTPPWDQADASSGPQLWEPDFDDPIFLQKLDGFLAAAANRYDGNPQVAFVDVGSFGVWGEGHTGWSTRLHYSSETVRRHIALHLKHFRKTLLVANDDFADHGRDLDGIDYAFEQGLTLRDDSILVQGGEDAYFNAPMAQRLWPRVPVILESEHYGHSKSRGVWGDGAKYLQAVEDYHASYVSIHWWPREFLAENRDLVNRINLRLGYRLQLIEAS